jgi:hypothetical protein
MMCAVSHIDWRRRGRYRDENGSATVFAKGVQPMPAMEFQVCYRSREARWVVTLGNSLYGAYLDKEQALLDAVDAARDALEVGREVQVWLREQQSPARVF